MQDLRFALRLLRRSPGFMTSAILTLAIGIGVNTAIYSIFNGLVRPLPVPGAHQLVYIASDLPSDDTGLQFKLSYAALEDYREGTVEVFSDVFGGPEQRQLEPNRCLAQEYQRVTGSGLTRQNRHEFLPEAAAQFNSAASWRAASGGEPDSIDHFVIADPQQSEGFDSSWRCSIRWQPRGRAFFPLIVG